MKITTYIKVILGITFLITSTEGCKKEILSEPQTTKQVVTVVDTTKKTITVTPKDTSKTPVTPPVVTPEVKPVVTPVVAPVQTVTVDYLNTFAYQAGSNDYFSLKSNTSWKIASIPSWATASQLSGTGDAKVTVTVQANTGAQRTGTISITGTGVAKATTISLVQIAAPVVPVAVVAVTTADFYVSPNGSDSNPGTLDKPFGSLSKAYSVMTPGQLTYIRGGHYYTTNDRSAMLTDRSGTAGNYIKIWAYPGETPIFSPASGYSPNWGICLIAGHSTVP